MSAKSKLKKAGKTKENGDTRRVTVEIPEDLIDNFMGLFGSFVLQKARGYAEETVSKESPAEEVTQVNLTALWAGVVGLGKAAGSLACMVSTGGGGEPAALRRILLQAFDCGFEEAVQFTVEAGLNPDFDSLAGLYFDDEEDPEDSSETEQKSFLYSKSKEYKRV